LTSNQKRAEQRKKIGERRQLATGDREADGAKGTRDLEVVKKYRASD
jgi:hypothetical protein